MIGYINIDNTIKKVYAALYKQGTIKIDKYKDEYYYDILMNDLEKSDVILVNTTDRSTDLAKAMKMMNNVKKHNRRLLQNLDKNMRKKICIVSNNSAKEIDEILDKITIDDSIVYTAELEEV